MFVVGGVYVVVMGTHQGNIDVHVMFSCVFLLMQSSNPKMSLFCFLIEDVRSTTSLEMPDSSSCFVIKVSVSLYVCLCIYTNGRVNIHKLEHDTTSTQRISLSACVYGCVNIHKHEHLYTHKIITNANTNT